MSDGLSTRIEQAIARGLTFERIAEIEGCGLAVVEAVADRLDVLHRTADVAGRGRKPLQRCPEGHAMKHRQRADGTDYLYCRECRRGKQKELKPCGTDAGYTRHLVCGEEACEPCKEAHRERGREYYRRRKAAEAAEARKQKTLEWEAAIVAMAARAGRMRDAS